MKYKKVPSISELIKQASLSEARNMSALPAMRFISNVTPSRRNVSNGRRKVQRPEDKKSVGEINWSSFAPSAGRVRGIDMLFKKESYNVIEEPSTLFLDLYPDAAAAYSLRQLQSNGGVSYPLVLVRRSSDDAEQSFTETQIIDGTLEAFCGAGNGQVVSWYDQSGNNNHANQSTAINQPYIVISGSVILENGKPSLQFDGSNHYLNYVGAIGISGSQNRSIFTTIKLDNNDNLPIISHGEFTGGTNRQVYSLTAELAIRIFGGNIIFGITDTSQMLIYNYLDGDSTFDISMYKDGSNLTYTSRGDDNLIETDDTEIYIMAEPLVDKYLSGQLQELILYPSDQTDNRTGIESNINSHYNIYWDGSQSGLLDDYPNASSAYSLRALNSSYTGPAIRVRRSSDDDEQDIKLLYNGELDTEGLLSFVGNDDGFVTVWYDQSGDGNDAIQATATNQGKIVDLGNLFINPDNSLPAIDVSSTYIFMSTTPMSTKNLFAVAKMNQITSTNYFAFSASPFSGMYYGGTANPAIKGIGLYAVSGGINSLEGEDISTHLANFYHNDTTYLVSKDSETPVELGTYSKLNINQILGRDLAAPTSLNGFMQEMIIYSTGDDSNNEAIKSNINSHYKIYWDGNQSALLDDYPNASAAYSLRALNSNYLGAAIRVRRSSDSAEKDIRLLYDGSLDTASLLSFVGAGDGFVTTWYDQSGEGNDASQGNANSQPNIVSSGSIILENGKAAINFTADYFSINSVPSSTEATILSVYKNNPSGAYKTIIGIGLNNGYVITTNDGKYNSFYRGVADQITTSNALVDTQGLIFFYTKSETNQTMYVNNTLYQNVTTPAMKPPTTSSRIGAYDFSGGVYTGIQQELIVYASNELSNRTGIETNINSHYNIYAEDILEFNPYNIWDSEHITIDGTTTTLHDFNTFGDKIDMSNPSASNQPTYNANSANFNGLPSFTFDGVSQYVKGDIVDYRTTDTSGVVVNVFRHLSGVFLVDLTFSQSSTSLRYISTAINTNSYRTLLTLTDSRSFRGNTNIVTGSPSSVVAYADEGSSYAMNINGNSETITMISGSNDGGAWFNGNQFDNVSIGAIIRSTGLTYGNLEWCMSGYFPYTDESTTLEIVNFLKNKYGVA